MSLTAPTRHRSVKRPASPRGPADSILGVSLFAEVAPDQFGKFNRAFVTLFRIAAGDTWIEPLPTLGPDGDLVWRPALFICSFIVLSVWVVLQVSVAVLLDNFVSVSMRMENDEKKRAAKQVKASSHFQSPLEPLVAKLSNEYTDGVNLSSNLASLFQVPCWKAACASPPPPAPQRGECVWTSGITGGPAKVGGKGRVQSASAREIMR